MRTFIFFLTILLTGSVQAEKVERYDLWAQIDAATLPGKILVLVMVRRPGLSLSSGGYVVNELNEKSDGAWFSFLMGPGESATESRESDIYVNREYIVTVSVKEEEERLIVKYSGIVQDNGVEVYSGSAWSRSSIINF